MRIHMSSFILVLLMGFTGCHISIGQETDSSLHWFPTDIERPKGWVMLLPGSSGLTIFDDDEHYFRSARQWNEWGYNAICIDYKTLYRSVTHQEQRSTGDKIKWCIDRSLRWMADNQKCDPEMPGAIVCWSLGAEGGMSVINDAEFCTKNRIGAAIFYYPSNRDSQPLANVIPLQIFVGTADDVTHAETIRGWVNEKHKNAAIVEMHEFPDAFHGFDICTLPAEKVVRLVPFVGPRATFGFHREATQSAADKSREFLLKHITR